MESEYLLSGRIVLTTETPMRKSIATATSGLLLAGLAVLSVHVAPPAAAGETAIAIKATELEPSPNPSLAYNRMAEQMGLFAKHGLVLQLGPGLGGGGPARVQAVVTNNTDVATSDIISVLGGIYSGAKIKILMVMTPYGDEQVWGQSKYKTLKDAEGESWGVASLGGAQRFNDQMAIQGMGLPADAFKWVAIPGGDGPRLQALETGRTQLATLSHVGAALAQAKGYTTHIHVLVPHTSKYTPPIPRLVIVAQESWIKAHQDAAQRYVEMMLDAMRQWQDNPQSWVTPGAAIFAKSGLSSAQLQAV
jgi:ABC-type nitrate/sulfonate/bicarbonate transport system substrate-binding protein